MAKKKQTFEEKLEELESTVTDMENSKIGINDLFEKYKKSKQLITELNAELDSLEQKIEIVNDEGETEKFNE
ncbi:MAG: exodeoxyribonuclease VII small subunit [Eubacteriales bacterium]|nr:exodeoxyribonuclease VII small subunit [Eubacteriales bacterium]